MKLIDPYLHIHVINLLISLISLLFISGILIAVGIVLIFLAIAILLKIR